MGARAHHEAMSEVDRLRAISRWFAAMRLAAAPVAIAGVATTGDFPPGYELWAWVACGALAAGAIVVAAVSFSELRPPVRRRVAEGALAFDIVITFAFIYLYSWESGQPT